MANHFIAGSTQADNEMIAAHVIDIPECSLTNLDANDFDKR